MTVVGILRAQAINAVFVDNNYVRNDLQVNGTNLFLIKLGGGLDAARQATLVQSQFWQYGVSAIPISSVAQAAVDQSTAF